MRNDDAPGPASRRLVAALLVCALLFVTGVGPRPAGSVWTFGYDVLLFNAGYVLSALVCLCAARRVPAERTAWTAMALGLSLAVAGNLTFGLVAVDGDTPQFPSGGDVASLLSFVPVCVALVVLVRARAPRTSASAWLDGVSGALGFGTVAIAALLGSGGALPTGDPLSVVAGLAFPLMAILVVALMGVAGGVLGLRRDPSILLVAAGGVTNLVGDVAYGALAPSGSFHGGGPFDLFFLAGAVLVALGAHASRVVPPGGRHPDLGARVGWRMVSVPLACSAASLCVLVADGALPLAARICAAGCVAATLVRSLTTFRELHELHAVRTQALTDELTGLPNRRALLDRASQVVASATVTEPAAVLLMDLDGFKGVNDGLGHHAGDELLRQVAQRLTAAMGPADVLGRLGGDEFAVLCPAGGRAGAEARAHRIRELVLQPFTVDGVPLRVGISIGVATAPVPATSVGELLRCADAAMYAAKAAGDGVRVHDTTTDGVWSGAERRAGVPVAG
ncbi:diguanylate cyclase domain-containing protein [Blastococcus sp. SYSU D00695]